MYFNVLKGAYLSLQAVDKVLPTADTGIERGSAIVESNGAWIRAHASSSDPAEYVHFALQNYTDKVAGMAGSRGQGLPGGRPVITGFAVGNPCEFQTDMFVAGTYTVGQLLMVADTGKLGAHTTGKNCVAQVTAIPANKYVNDAVLVTGFSTGNYLSVITARTLWVPRLATA